MVIEINTDFLAEKLVNPTEYCYLYALFIKDYSLGESIAIQRDKVQVNTADLEARGWIKINGETIQEVELRQPALDLFIVHSLEAKWSEFKATYPRKDGSRQLHDQQEKCKQKYFSLISKKLEHEKIMRGLNNELEARKLAGLKRSFFPAPKTMSAWLNQKHWLTYLNAENEVPDEEIGSTNAI